MKRAVTVADLMSRKLITVSPDDPVERVVRLLRYRGVRHLLVVENGDLVGIVSDRDIKRALDPQRGRKKKVMSLGGLFFLLEPFAVREIMSPGVISIQPDATVRLAAQAMVAERIGALPVMDNGKLVGIITETDLLRHLAASES
jgi:acetoin utilization protein AcuB